MAITYNGGTNTITVTGYTIDVPCTFENLYQADVGGGWGVITKQCVNQYCLNAKLLISSGYFADIKKQILVKDLATTQEIRVNSGGHFRSGTLVDESIFSTVDGCSFHFQRTGWSHGLYAVGSGEILLFSTHLSTDSTSYLGITKITKMYNTYMDKVYLRSSNVTMYNVMFMGGMYAMYNTVGIWDKIVLRSQSNSGVTIANNGDVKNVNQAGCGGIRAWYITTTAKMTNCDIDVWHFSWNGCTANMYRKYTLNLKVEDKNGNGLEGAGVKIWDKNGSLVTDTTTNVNGNIAEQTLNYGYYNAAGGDTPTMQTPHTLQITKPGYQVYEQTFTMDEKVEWVVSMRGKEWWWYIGLYGGGL